MKRLEDSTIYVNLKRLRAMIYDTRYAMQKCDAVVYWTQLADVCNKVFANYVMAFDVQDDKEHYLIEALGWYTVLRADLELCKDKNIIHFDGKKNEDGVHNKKIELFTIVATIDDDLCKWKARILKGKSVRE